MSLTSSGPRYASGIVATMSPSVETSYVTEKSTQQTDLRLDSATRRQSGEGGDGKRRCADKDALCRAMGTLFLQHRVEKLQGHVDRLNHQGKDNVMKAKESSCSWKTGWKGGCSKKWQVNAGASSSKLSNDSSTCMQEKNSKDAASMVTSFSMQDEPSSDKGQAMRLIIVDVSLVIYSLRTIHEWLKDGNCRIIVPIETLRTLDVLKKGDENLNLAARKAVRFLEEKSMLISTSESAVNDKIVPGLVPQRQSETVNRAEWTSLESIIKKRAGYEDEQVMSFDEYQQLSHSHQETISCLFYFFKKYNLCSSPSLVNSSSTSDNGSTSSSSSSNSSSRIPVISLALALPPPHLDSCEDFAESNPNMVKYIQRADGGRLLKIARQMRLGMASSSSIGHRLIVAPTAASWLTANSTSTARPTK